MKKPIVAAGLRCDCTLALVIGAILLFCAAMRGEAAEAARAQTNGFRFIDLAPFAMPADASARQFSVLPIGLQNFHDVPFLIGPRVAVTGIESARTGEFFPTEVTGIKIGGKAKRIHLLHGTMFADKDGVPVAKIIFHYANGSDETVRLGYGVHLRGWIAPRLEKRSELFDPNSHLAWADADERRGTASRIFQTALENPKPGETIISIDIVSLFSRAAPFVIALSVEEADSTLADNRPMPSRKLIKDLREFSDDIYRREISVRVTDGPSGAPPKNAVVTLGVSDDKESYFFGEAKPDAQGTCRMSYPPLHAVGLRIWVHAPGRAPSIISESKTNQTKFSGEYAVTLKPGVEVGGLVKDSDGKSVAGAQIVIHKINRISPHHYGRVDYDAVLTGADGKWTSRSLPDDLSGFSFQVTHDDYRPALYVTAGFAPPPTNTSSSVVSSSSSISYQRMPDGTLVPINTRRPTNTPRGQSIPLLTSNALLSANAEMILQPAPLLEGNLVDTQGKPVPAAEVIVQSRDSDRKYLRTDAKGHFQTRVAEAGQYVIVLRDGFAPVSRFVRTGPKMTPVEIKLEPPRVLRGRVQDRNQRPVSGARVRLDDWNGTSDLLRFQTLTDEQGTFTWTGAPSDQITLYVSKTNYYNNRSSYTGNTDDITIMLNRAPGVYGKVYDADTKKPIPSFTVIPGRKYSSSDSQIRWERYESVRGRDGEYSLKMDSYLFQPEARVLVEAMGYQPQISPPFNNPDSYTNDFALKKGKGVEGIVELPDGTPAIAATLSLVERGEYGYLESGQLRSSSSSSTELVRSDAKGHFEFPPKLDPDKVYVSHAQGFAEAKVADVLKSHRIVLQPWGRIKGFLRVGERIEPDQTVRLNNEYPRYMDQNTRPAILSFYQRIDPEPDGSFVFEKVPPGEHRLSLEYRKENQSGETPLSHGFPVMVKPDETADVTIGGTGRRVTGHMKVTGGDASDVDWRRDVHRLTLVLTNPILQPTNVHLLPPQDQQRVWNEYNTRYREFWNSEAGRALQRAERQYVLVFETNGNFHADNVPPGEYNLSLNVTDPEEENYNRRFLGSLSKPVAVPNDKNARLNAPLDLGTLELSIHPRLKLGKPVPTFEAKTRDGKAIKLSDFRGKPVLLHFWGLSVGYSTYDLQVLKEFQSTYVRDGRLAIIGYNMDADQDNAERFAKQQGMAWPQTYLGDWQQATVPGMFGISGNSACILVDAEGRLASNQLRGSSIRNVVQRSFAGELE